MSLRKKKDHIRSLKFDPFQTDLQDGVKKRFEWAVDHEYQVAADWCWAACLSNALSCFGVYVNQDEIVERYRTDHDGSPGATNQKIPTPKHVIDLWRSYGFYRVRPRKGKLTVDELTQEIVTRGPVQIEFWRKETKDARHLALIFGLRETQEGIEVGVSDPLATEPVWLKYEVLTGPSPLDERFGEWSRSYVGLDYQKGYLRRFFGQPSTFLTGLPDDMVAKDAPVPAVLAVASKLQFDPPPHPYPPLPNELSLALYGYRQYRYAAALKNKKKDREADLREPLFLYESIRIWRPPHEIDHGKPLRDQLQPYLWHHQIHDAKGHPRYYAEAWYFEKIRERFDRAWRTSWVGEKWKAERVDAAIQKLDADFKDRKETVCMVQFRRHGLVTLLLPDSGIHIVVSAHTERQTDFPLLETFTDARLRETMERLSSAPLPEPMHHLESHSAVA